MKVMERKYDSSCFGLIHTRHIAYTHFVIRYLFLHILFLFFTHYPTCCKGATPTFLFTLSFSFFAM